MVIMHGLFGMLDNWQTLGKKWAENHQVFLVDLRNHGHSPHSDHFSYQYMMEDVEEFMDDLFLDDVILLGHSMGGKVGMKFAQKFPDLIDKLIVADIGPKMYPVHHQKILEGLHAVPLDQVKSRGEVKDIIKNYIPEEGTQQFFLKNLYWKEKGRLDWRFNLEGISNNIGTVGEDMLGNVTDVKTLFIRGGNSNYILDEDIPSIKETFPNSDVKTIPGAGHWLHAENPGMFYDIVTEFIG